MGIPSSDRKVRWWEAARRIRSSAAWVVWWYAGGFQVGWWRFESMPSRTGPRVGCLRDGPRT